MICPICAASLTPDQQTCSNCKSDLTYFLTLVYQADLLFNDAVGRMRRGDYDGAGDLLCRASAMRPDDVEIKKLWIQACYGAGNLKKALGLLLELSGTAPSEELSMQCERLMHEYERSASSPETLVRDLLLKQSDRMESMIQRLEHLTEPESAPTPPAKESNDEPV
jgi:thioredoxin-like negative regulator of GroEL